MRIEVILAVILPIIVYTLLEKNKGLKFAVASSLVSASLLVTLVFFMYDFKDPLLWAEYGFLMVFGLIALFTNDERFFKIQPFLVSLVGGIYILATFHFAEPIFIRYQPLMEKMATDPSKLGFLRTPWGQSFLTELSWQLGVLLVVHAPVMFYAAKRRSTVFWMWARLSVYPASFLVVFLAAATA